MEKDNDVSYAPEKISKEMLEESYAQSVFENGVKSKRKTKKKSKKILLAILIVLFLFIGAFIGVAGYYLNMFEPETEVVTVPPESEDYETDVYDVEYASEEVYTEYQPEEIEIVCASPMEDDNLVNILLVGQDRRPGESRARSDAMILCSLNPETGKVSIISFLRDLYVKIPGYSDNRMNAAYAFGGFDLLKSTLYANFGITVDGCFEADFDGFAACIDLIGGVDITLSEAEANIVGGGAVSGYNHLNGRQTLTYARIRKIGTDFGRTERQRKVILACLQKARSMGASGVLQLVNEALPLLSTDMSAMQITSLVTKFSPLLPKVTVDTYFIPASGAYYDAMIRGMAVLVPNIDKNCSLLRDEYLPF